jgi:RNA polymerase sigma-70 factor (ECF subfamily)
MLVRGPAAVARHAVSGIRQMRSGPAAGLRPVLVNGSAGAIVTRDGHPFAVMGFTITDGKIAGIDAIADPGRVRTITAEMLS